MARRSRSRSSPRARGRTRRRSRSSPTISRTRSTRSRSAASGRKFPRGLIRILPNPAPTGAGLFVGGLLVIQAIAVASPKPPKTPSQFDADLARLADAFRDNDPATFYTKLMNSKVLYTVTQTENLWTRVGEEGEVQSVVYLHFLKSWDRIRGHALAGGGPVAGYLVEVIRNAVRDALRKQERRQKRERSLVRGLDGERGNEAEAVADDSGSVLDSVIAAEEHQRLKA